ncbi:hypothetical protein GCM10009733_020610 [Nonomuraea maheshkhaliensis]|uniref:Uncharacterized protein n=1 Tax=Nonomuraea maheshkhaliensis TaxID=419590 RepID=A0ABN2F2B4_9ACTN
MAGVDGSVTAGIPTRLLLRATNVSGRGKLRQRFEEFRSDVLREQADHVATNVVTVHRMRRLPATPRGFRLEVLSVQQGFGVLRRAKQRWRQARSEY